MPHGFKTLYRRAGALVPYRWRQGTEYRRTLAFLLESATWSPDRIREYQSVELQLLLKHCGADVPYYRDLFDREGIDVAAIRTTEDLTESRIPFMDSTVVAAELEALTATNIASRRHIRTSTGGTSGKPLPLRFCRGITYQRITAYWDAFKLWFGHQPTDPMITLRNDALPGQRQWDYSPLTRILRLDPFKLSPATVRDYVTAIIESGISYLHTYPSAAMTLLKMARDAGETRKMPIRTIFATSENIYPGQREFLEEGYEAKVVSMYGHSESCVLACECECACGYHVLPQYGVFELVDSEGRAVHTAETTGEIVGTGFNNPVMPLVRYRTADFAQYVGGNPCPCGRPYPLIDNIQGRWLQEMVVRPDGAHVSITALNMHSEVFNHVRKFQFVQRVRGALQVRVVPGDGFTSADKVAIQRSVSEKIGPSMHIDVLETDDIVSTRMGKHRFLIQELDLGDDRPGTGAPE